MIFIDPITGDEWLTEADYIANQKKAERYSKQNKKYWGKIKNESNPDPK